MIEIILVLMIVVNLVILFLYYRSWDEIRLLTESSHLVIQRSDQQNEEMRLLTEALTLLVQRLERTR